MQAVLLVGPTGAGKTPLGEYLERQGLWGRTCHHFDFGANLRAVVDGDGDPGAVFTAGEVAFLRQVLREGALLEAGQFHLATRILDGFLKLRQARPADLLVLNGLPRHVSQAKALAPLVTVIAIIELRCEPGTVAERLRRDTGGDRAGRADDTAALVARKLATFCSRTQPLIAHYREQGVPVVTLDVGVNTQPSDLIGGMSQIPGA
jgi:adenylate kinase